MERPIPASLLTVHALARLSAASRYDILKLVAAGVITPIARIDYGKKAVPVFTAEDAITAAAAVREKKSPGASVS